MKKRFGYFSALSFLFPYIKKYKSHFLIFQFGWFSDTVCNLLIPALLGILIDEIVYYRNIESFLKTALLVLIISIFLCVVYIFVYAQHQYLMGMFTYSIKKDIMKHWLYGETVFISNNEIGAVISFLQKYSVECFHFVTRNTIHFANGILKLVIMTVVLLIIDWRVACFILIAAPASVYISAWFGKKNQFAGEKVSNFYENYSGWLNEIISSFMTIRILGSQQKVKDDLLAKNKDLLHYQNMSELTSLKSGNIISLINLLIRLVIYFLAGVLSASKGITVGYLVIIISYYDILVEQIWWTSNSYVDSQRRIPMIESIYEFVKIPLETHNNNKPDLIVKNADISFSNIDFSYGKKKVFENFSLSINGGKKTAVVGTSGCGKTTLAYLLLRFYTPQRGEVSIDCQDISLCSLQSVRSNIGLISQNIYIINGNIRENILFGYTNTTENDIIDACKKAGIWNYIESLPEGLDADIGNDGYKLSGGQKQRIAIARVYIRNPSIIIYDEATSSLDETSEKEIIETWADIFNNRTAIFITHKLSVVQLCDAVVVLKDGKIDEIGSTNYIIHNNPEFKRLFDQV